MDEDKETFSDWEEENDVFIVSLFSHFSSGDIKEVFEHDLLNFKFNIKDIASKFCVDEVDLIKLINFIRKQIHDAQCCSKVIDDEFINNLKWKISADEFMHDEYLKPVMANDALLCQLDDIMELGEVEDDDGNNVTNNVNYYKDKMIQQGYDVNEIKNYEALASELSVPLSTSKKTKPMNRIKNGDSGSDSDSTASEPNDGYYFESYAHIGIHETMLRDSSRTVTYGNSLLKNPEFVKDKLVIDVGCGTGILSMFACRAGALHVVGIDNSNIIKQTRLIVDDNGFANNITLIQGRVEEICCEHHIGLLKSGAVSKIKSDLIEVLNKYGTACSGVIIVSEWMGYGLYFENMLSSVFVLRSYVAKYCSEILGKTMEMSMFPHTAVLFIEGMDTETNRQQVLPPRPPSIDSQITVVETEDRVNYWDNVYGFNMSRMKSLFIKEAAVQGVQASWMKTTRATVSSLNCMEATDADLDFIVPFEIKPLKDANANTELRAFNISFDVVFNSPGVKYVSIYILYNIYDANVL